VSGAVGRNHHLAYPFGTDQNIHLPRVAATAAAAIMRTEVRFGPFSEILFWCSTPDTLVPTTWAAVVILLRIVCKEAWVNLWFSMSSQQAKTSESFNILLCIWPKFVSSVCAAEEHDLILNNLKHELFPQEFVIAR